MKFKSNSGFSAVEALLILVIVGILGFAGWFVYHSQKVTNKSYDSQSSTQLSTTKKATKPIDPYAGWKTYTSMKEGLSLKYPATWTEQNDPCVNPATQAEGECMQFLSPKTTGSPYYFVVTYYWNQAAQTGNMYVVSSKQLSIPNAKTPLYMAATDVGIGDTSGLIYSLNLVNQNYPIGKISKVSTAISSQTQSGISFSLDAAMIPLAGAQQAVGYSVAQYEAQPDYANVVKLFQSIRYN